MALVIEQFRGGTGFRYSWIQGMEGWILMEMLSLHLSVVGKYTAMKMFNTMRTCCGA